MTSRRLTLKLIVIAATAPATAIGVRKLTEPDLAQKVERDFWQFARRTSLESLSPRESLQLMASFAREVAYPHDIATPYGDTLLFEYGVFDWGKGEHFDFKITRQVVFPFASGTDADDHIIQISITLRYAPGSFRHLPIMTKWAKDLPVNQTMEAFAVESQGYVLASAMSPKDISLYSSAQ